MGGALAARVRRLEVSATVAMAARAGALRERGVRVLDFSVGEPDQPTPQHVVEAACAALAAGRTRYAPAAGLGELRAAVAHRYREDFRARVAAEDVVVTVGGKQGLALVCQALLDTGSEVVVPTPAWPTFAAAARIAGGRPVFLPLSPRNGHRLRARSLARVLSPRTRVVVVNSPSNPTGAVVGAEELLAVAGMAGRRGSWLLLDDTYSRLCFRDEEAADLAALQEAARGRLIVVGTASKTYCMTGWRIGWVIAARPVVAACTALNSHSVQGPATFAQVAAARALTGPQEGARALLEEYRRRRDFIHPALASLPGVRCARPDGGFYVFPDVSRCLSRELPDSAAFCARLLEEEAVATVPGEGFHAPGFFRLSFAAALDDLREGALRIAAFVGRHAGSVARGGSRARA